MDQSKTKYVYLDALLSEQKNDTMSRTSNLIYFYGDRVLARAQKWR